MENLERGCPLTNIPEDHTITGFSGHNAPCLRPTDVIPDFTNLARGGQCGTDIPCPYIRRFVNEVNTFPDAKINLTDIKPAEGDPHSVNGVMTVDLSAWSNKEWEPFLPVQTVLMHIDDGHIHFEGFDPQYQKGTEKPGGSHPYCTLLYELMDSSETQLRMVRINPHD